MDADPIYLETLISRRAPILGILRAHGFSHVRILLDPQGDRREAHELLVAVEPAASVYSLAQAQQRLTQLLGVDVTVVAERSERGEEICGDAVAL